MVFLRTWIRALTWAGPCVVACVVALWSGIVHADEPPRVESARVWLRVHRGGETMADGRRVDRRGALVEGTVEYTLDRAASEGDTLSLLDFAAFMSDEPVALDEVSLSDYVAGPFDRGALAVKRFWGAKRVRREGPRRDLVVELEAGTRTVTLRYEVDVPHRYWPFGCVRRRCSLSGAIAPLPSTRARGGRWLDRRGRVVAPVRWTVESAALATPGTVRPGDSPDDRERLRPDELFVVGGRGELTQYPSAFWGPRWHVERRIAEGVIVEVHHPYRRPSGQVPHETKVQLRRDVPGSVLQMSHEIVELLAGVGLEQPPDRELAIVQGPLRSGIAEAHPGVVLVSDEAFQLFPAGRFLKFHEDAIARAILDSLVERELRGSHDPSTDLWLPGAIAFSLLDVWRRQHEHRDEFAHDILRGFTFVPAVDRFLYTQQASFSQSYFRGVEDSSPLRNHPLWFAHELPTGRRIHEKLVDTIGPAKLERLYRTVAEDRDADPIRTASRVYGYDLRWFFDQWLGRYPSVDYSIEDVRSAPYDGRWRHEIDVKRRGERAVIEPVQLMVVERGGRRHYLGWNGQLAPTATEPREGEHTFVVVTDERVDTVLLDPRTRLLEQPQAPHDNVDPRFDNRVPAQFRFLYTGVGLSVAASEFVNAATVRARFNAVTGFAAFESSLRRDLRRTGQVTLSRDRETNLAVGLGANLWFGRKVNLQRRRARVRALATTSWLNGRSLDPRGGVRVTERISIIDDTRGFVWWPEKGRWLSAGLTARHTLRTDAPKDERHDLEFDLSWIHMWRLAHDHVIATSIASELVVPLVGRPEFRSLTRVGGIGGLSGYLADEAFGLATINAQIEYRHVFLSDMRPNIAHLSWLRSIGGIAFAGVASISECESYRGWFGKNSWYTHVGYALTAYVSALGVTPQLFRVEAAVPLIRRRGIGCLDRVLPDYLAQVQGLDEANVLLPPLQINVTFNQAF